MTTLTFNIAFTRSAQLWSQQFRTFEKEKVAQLQDRSQLRNLPSEAARLLLYLDPLFDFERRAIQQLHEKHPNLIVIGWLAGQQLDNATVMSLLDNGIRAIITDTYTPDEIVQAFHDAERYGYHYNHLLGSALLHQWKKASTTSLLRQLDERERKAIQLRSQGKTAVEIGNVLHLSHKTIDKLFWKLYQRTGCRNFLELKNSIREECLYSYEG